jgi:hypothetical protein
MKTVWLDIVEVVMEWVLDTDNDRKGFLNHIINTTSSRHRQKRVLQVHVQCTMFVPFRIRQLVKLVHYTPLGLAAVRPTLANRISVSSLLSFMMRIPLCSLAVQNAWAKQQTTHNCRAEILRPWD